MKYDCRLALLISELSQVPLNVPFVSLHWQCNVVLQTCCIMPFTLRSNQVDVPRPWYLNETSVPKASKNKPLFRDFMSFLTAAVCPPAQRLDLPQ